MSTPEPIGPVYFSEPRAVKIREPENLTAIHSAVHGELNIVTDSVLETKSIMENWSLIMQAVSEKVELILSEATPTSTNTPEGMKTGM
ncbi:hypothetical protein MADRUGA_70 [Mycobacterium phage Madruga]|uniref:Uncharacterized protein n=1 Tax=Mycobacterium phage Madruga TaxID=1675552 RepID=A0A0K1LT98_9CAUD|nr:hypothetical protein MADRUGA_70 [Mycobacterium phage Madruga]